MLRKIFTDHPRSVGETYFEHMGQASGFGITMIVAGLACLLHGIVPALFVRTGSLAIARLHDRMILNRRRHAPSMAFVMPPVLDYVI